MQELHGNRRYGAADSMVDILNYERAPAPANDEIRSPDVFHSMLLHLRVILPFEMLTQKATLFCGKGKVSKKPDRNFISFSIVSKVTGSSRGFIEGPGVSRAFVPLLELALLDPRAVLRTAIEHSPRGITA